MEGAGHDEPHTLHLVTLLPGMPLITLLMFGSLVIAGKQHVALQLSATSSHAFTESSATSLRD